MAEMIVSGGNPLEDLRTLRNIDMVIMHDKVISSPKVKTISEAEAELDKWL